MDFSKFSDSDFDAKEWVNGALRAHKDARVPIDVSENVSRGDYATISLTFSGACVDTRDEATALYPGRKLSRDPSATLCVCVCLQEVNKSLEETSMQVVQNLPRLVYKLMQYDIFDIYVPTTVTCCDVCGGVCCV